MVYKGRVKNGTVILDSPAGLPDGSEVDVILRAASPAAAAENIPTLYEQYKDLIGIFDDLPSDFAENHDHYIHGTPKR